MEPSTNVFCACGHAMRIHNPDDPALCPGCVNGRCEAAKDQHHSVYHDHY